MIIKKNTGALLDASKEVGLEVNAEKTKYVFMSRHQTAEQNYYKTVSSKYFADVTKFKYLETTVTNQNCIHKEIQSRLNSENACYQAVKNILSSRLPSMNAKIKLHNL
jgi:hypothetical protein